jgi:hypothetical protein
MVLQFVSCRWDAATFLPLLSPVWCMLETACSGETRCYGVGYYPHKSAVGGGGEGLRPFGDGACDAGHPGWSWPDVGAGHSSRGATSCNS